MCLGCILFHFYIKPQPRLGKLASALRCILFHFYIKPQPFYDCAVESYGCILFHFYIKPQRCPIFHALFSVVSYSISTSNHNLLFSSSAIRLVVSYSISTSNHNRNLQTSRPSLVVSYSISTSNHNLWRIRHYFQAHYHLNHILIFNGML